MQNQNRLLNKSASWTKLKEGFPLCIYNTFYLIAAFSPSVDVHQTAAASNSFDLLTTSPHFRWFTWKTSCVKLTWTNTIVVLNGALVWGSTGRLPDRSISQQLAAVFIRGDRRGRLAIDSQWLPELSGGWEKMRRRQQQQQRTIFPPLFKFVRRSLVHRLWGETEWKRLMSLLLHLPSPVLWQSHFLFPSPRLQLLDGE